MGKGGGTPGISPDVQKGLLANQTALANIAQTQSARATELFGLTEPGLKTAEQFYQDLASGDPGAISRAIAPGAQQASEAAAGAKANIMATAPPGGEKNLALELTDVNRGAEVSKMASGAFLGAPNALAQLAGQGVGESISAAGTGISGLSAASSTLGTLGNLQLEGQQLQAQQKGQSLGAFGGLLQAGASIGGAYGSSAGIDWLAALAAV